MDSFAPDRLHPFEGVFNFRDVGGYRGLDGRTVRWRRLFRSDSVHRLDHDDLEAFPALGVRTVIDLRRPHEVERDGRVADYDGLAYRHIHPEHAEWGDTPYDPAIGLDRWMADRYRDLAETGTDGLGSALRIIADPDSAPVLVHCVAGKDRTGVVCALTLSLLGVDDEDVATDYALSTEASERFSAWIRAQWPDRPEDELPPPFLSSPAGAMRLFLAELRERHGSVESYARSAGLTPTDLRTLREHLLS